MHSCIYEGTVTHRRNEPVVHQFKNRLFMVYLDLDELPSLVGDKGLIADSKYGSCSFLRDDHVFNNSQSLATDIREIVLQQSGNRPMGPIRLLTQLRYFGAYFSPLNLFYIFDEQDISLEYIVAEVSNTPWNERHCYVLWDGNVPVKAMSYASHTRNSSMCLHLWRWIWSIAGDSTILARVCLCSSRISVIRSNYFVPDWS